jgi:drug/metabolite transporter (DMT)-like permease
MPAVIGSRRLPFLGSFKLSSVDFLLLCTVCFWGVNFSVVKSALVEIPPVVFVALRFLIASALMLVLTLALGHQFKFQRRDLWLMIGLGILGNTGYQLFFIFGVAETTANNTSLILATVPAWVALVGTGVKMERLEKQGWLGVGLSLLGIVLIILGSDRQAEFKFGGATFTGDFLVLLATLCWAGYTLLSRPLLRRYPSLAVTTFTTMAGSIPLIFMAFPTFIRLDWAAISWSAWGGLAFSGIFGIALAYIFWNQGVAQLGSTRTSLYSNLVPPVSLLANWLWLGETLTPQQWWGAGLALGGIVLARRFTHSID